MIEFNESVNERKVLKIKSNDNEKKNVNVEPQKPEIGNEDNIFDGSDENIDNINTNNDGDNDNFNFDKNFDAGVDADEHEDPKKYIQQLTGKLSQKLRDYNNNQEDSDLNKYVAGMIVVQASKGLDQDAKDEIIDKINNSKNSEEDVSDDNADDDFDNQVGNDGTEQNDIDDDLGLDVNENKQNIEEILNDVISAKPELKNKIPINKSYRKKPFTNPSIK